MTRQAALRDTGNMRQAPVTKRKTLQFLLLTSRNTIKISGATSEKYNLEFEFPLSKTELTNLQTELQKWQNSAYDLKTALILAGTFPERITKQVNGLALEVDPSTVLGRSFIQGRARDFIYNGCGLEPRSIAALETALYLNSKNRRYDAYNYFRRELGDEQRALAEIIFSRLTISKSPVNGVFVAEARDIQIIKRDIEEMEFQRSEYSKSTNPNDWNNALISTYKGDFYVRVPKSLVSPDYFKKMIGVGKYPDELAVVFNLGHVLDLIIQRSKGFPLKSLSPKDWNLVNSFPRNELNYRIL